ncbi:membrane protein FAM174A isoform X3 [Canis lupus baileyi]|uniref:Transmembrane protein 157 n=3 Tax=Canis lupus TaxID=9612 RepID=A0A8C0SMD7_CANLF|nr:membrane protein FAM174A isoform X3 [Canis lupus familiaris]XP_025293346.1 membrane protein FAM174A isoform X2 [Canis lupus dingo]XP_025293347.1 membrane protein FAM174A isoform X3 [Canis lupus dingo]XP_038388175.1 membrane protein FAM174A isoform X2 [Canis lupus familiaris]XP_038388176.1 membrane protein FAM174A isoform X3 [Canis lupus familiaris]XP_038516664.1 membrane protein FAM174A isoform X2 [Canis lupus familiaris]XP_038516665.1 membrane protein FAM174A isoform X3 [Canis lupus famil|eukprot:XP_005618119.1 membrane protein FAM174A isoform X3 [Canis lupus familiaris]
MKGSRCGRGVSPLLAAALLLLLLLPPPPPGPGGAWASLLRAAAPGPAAPGTSPPLRPGPTAAGSPGRAPADAAGPRGAEGGNGSSPRAGLAADDSGGKAREEDSAGGSLAVSPNPGDKPMTQRALTVLMVVSGAVLVYFVVRTVRMRRRNRKTRRYGVLDTNIENMELTPLEQDDEDDDNTLFDANHPRR